MTCIRYFSDYTILILLFVEHPNLSGIQEREEGIGPILRLANGGKTAFLRRRNEFVQEFESWAVLFACIYTVPYILMQLSVLKNITTNNIKLK